MTLRDPLAQHLTELEPGVSAGVRRVEADTAQRGWVTGTTPEAIAIIGMACRFPRSKDIPSFWATLCEGVDAIGDVPSERWRIDDHYDSDRRAPGKSCSRQAGFLEDVAGFDPEAFGISPREAESMDPQQRLALELSWEALEDAGIASSSLRGSRTGVFFGAMWTDYEKRHGLRSIGPHSGTGWHLGVVPGRVSYYFGLRGPSLAINTACSSSLVAVDLARRSLQSRETDLALVGGVSLMLAPHVAIAMSQFGGTSANSRGRAFDARADGYVRGEGGGVVVLRRLRSAHAAGDRIYCVIRGSAVNNDGASAGLTVPSGEAQVAVLREAYHCAGVEPHEVDFVEAHGTGTAVGDPIEANSLGEALSVGRSSQLLLGSVKTNIGHTEAASGIAGLIKTSLSVYHACIPPNLHFDRPNPEIEFERFGLEVPVALRAWPETKHPRTAGVNSFGFGGTNCHVVLQQAPSPAEAPSSAPAAGEPRCLLLSAHCPQALEARLEQLVRASKEPDFDARLPDLAHTLDQRRDHLDCRAAIICRDGQELRQKLTERELHWRPGVRSSRTVWVFSGHGSQWPGMGRRLAQQCPAFAEALADCSAELEPALGWSVMNAVCEGGLAARLERVQDIQAAIFAMQIALTHALWAAGLEADAVVGHSMGEVAAAYAARALTLSDAVRITTSRGKQLARIADQGAMLAISLSTEQTCKLIADLEGRVSLAVDSGGSCVVSGDVPDIQALAMQLERTGVECRRVRVNVAAHSHQIVPLAGALEAEIHGLRPVPERLTMFSSVTGGQVSHLDLVPGYWVANLRDRVRFAEALDAVLAHGYDSFVEVSPHPLLTHSLQQAVAARGDHVVTATLRRDRCDVEMFCSALGAIYCAGAKPDLRVIDPAPRRLVSLPTYPWQRKRFWHEAEPDRGAVSAHELQARFDPAKLPFLTEHEVWGSATLSAGGLAELVLRASSALSGGGPVELRGLTFPGPLVVGAEPVEVTLHGGRFSVCSRQTLVSGEFDVAQVNTSLRRETPHVSSGREHRAWAAGGESRVDAAHFYASLEAQGIVCRGQLRCVDHVVSTPGFARVALQPGTVRVGVLDAIFQALAAASARPGSLLVVGYDSFAVGDHIESATTIEAWLHPMPGSASAAVAKGSVEAFDSSGNLLASLRGARCKPLPERAPQLGPECVFARAWKRVPAIPAKGLGSWLLLGQPSNLSKCAAAWLAEAGVAFTASEDLDADTLGGVAGVLWVPAFEPPLTNHGGEGAEQVELLTRACLELGRHVSQLGRAKLPPEFVVLTERACAIGVDGGASSGPVQPAAHSLWAAARVAALEHPGARLRLIDVDGFDVEPPLLLSSGEHSELAWRGGSPYTATTEPVTLSASFAPWRAPAGTILVAGGLGGMGRKLARWLAERGAGHLLLLGRSAPSDAAQRDIEHMRRAGAEVRVEAVDVACAEQLREAVARAERAGPPLCGVVHAAAVTRDSLMQQMNAVHFEQVLRPKVAGVLNLHALAAQRELAFFVSCGSLGAWLGLPGQAAYAAGNAFLDALSLQRRARGLPALSIGWCGWEQVGFAGTQGGRQALELLRLKGIDSLSEAQALLVFERLLSGDWPPVVALMPPASGPTLEATYHAGSAKSAGAAFVDALRAVRGSEARTAALLDHVREQVALVLRQAKERVDLERPLLEQGMDSMMGVELAERLDRSLGSKSPRTLTWQYPTVMALSRYFESALGFAAPASRVEDSPAADLAECASSAASTDPDQAELSALLDQLESLSDEDAKALLGAG